MLPTLHTQGKLESVTFKQTEGYLKPLFKQMKKKVRNSVTHYQALFLFLQRTLPDILRFLALICSHLLNREYVKVSQTIHNSTTAEKVYRML